MNANNPTMKSIIQAVSIFSARLVTPEEMAADLVAAS